MAILRAKVSAVAAGSAGSAVGIGQTTILVQGVIHAVYLRRDEVPVATTDVFIREVHENPSLPVLTVSNLSADGWYYPRVTLHDVLDGSAIVGPVDYQSVRDHLELRIEGANAGSIVTATIVWDDGLAYRG